MNNQGNEEDTERFEWLCRLVRDGLETEELLDRLTLILGDAPCGCREAGCPHLIVPSVESLRMMIDGARESGMGWTMRSIHREAEVRWKEHDG